MSAGGQRLAVGTLDGRVILYELDKRGTPQYLAEVNPGVGPISGISMGRDLETVAFSSERGSVMIWSRGSGAAPRLLTKFPTGQSFVAIEGNGKLVVTASAADGTQAIMLADQKNVVDGPLSGIRAITGIGFDRNEE